MKKFILFCVLVFVFFMVHPRVYSHSFDEEAASAKWKEIGPKGGEVIGIAANPVDPTELFAVVSDYPGRVYKTTNSGNKWKKMATLQDSLWDVTFHPSDPNIIYALGTYGVFRSSDHGSTWEKLFFKSRCYAYYGKIAISPKKPKTLYVVGSYNYKKSGNKRCMALFKSTNEGQKWTVHKINSSSNYGYTYSLAVDPLNANIVYAGGYYSKGQTYYKVFKSTNGGKNWKDITGPINYAVNDIAVDPLNPKWVYACTTWGVYRSSNGGLTWSKNSFANGYDLACDPTNPNIIYAGYSRECYKSMDGGVTWTKLMTGLQGYCNRMLVAKDKVFYTSSAGVYRSTNGGTSWKAKNNGIKATNVPAIAVAPSSPNILYAECANNGFFKSTNSGKKWKRLPYFYRCDSIIKIAVNPKSASKLFILAGG